MKKAVVNLKAQKIINSIFEFKISAVLIFQLSLSKEEETASGFGSFYKGKIKNKKNDPTKSVKEKKVTVFKKHGNKTLFFTIGG